VLLTETVEASRQSLNMQRNGAADRAALGVHSGSGLSWREVAAGVVSNLSLFGLDIAAPLSLTWYGVVGPDAELRSPYHLMATMLARSAYEQLDPVGSWLRSLATGACWRTSCPAARRQNGVQYLCESQRCCLQLGPDRLTR